MRASRHLPRSIITLAALFALVLAGLALAPAAAGAAEPWEWTQINEDGFGGAAPLTNEQVAALCEFNGQLYASTRNNELGAEVWRYDGGTAWTQVNQSGFGNPANRGTDDLIVYNGKLYVGVWNDSGCWVNSYDGSTWTPASTPNFGDAGNTYSSAADFIIFNGSLYCAAGLYDSNVYRYDGGTTWTKVTANDFGNANNERSRCLAVHNGVLYAGIYNDTDGGEVWAWTGSGNWTQVGSAGLDDVNNIEIRSLFSYNGSLYGGTATPDSHTCGVYRYGGGSTWSRVSPPELAADVVRSMTDYQGLLTVGVSNDGTGASVWAFDGTTWNQVSPTGFSGQQVDSVQCLTAFDGRLCAGTGKWGATPGQVWAGQPPASSWYLAEGTTTWGFETYITIENPNDQELTARVTYMDANPEAGAGRVLPSRDVTLPPLSQTTVDPRWDLGDFDFCTRVDCLEGEQIAVDRTMVWTGEGAASPEAHNSIGVTESSNSWYMPEGSSNHGFETWTTVQNPNGVEAALTITYMTEGFGEKKVNKQLPAYSRGTYSMGEDIGSFDASIQVDSDLPVIAERSVYRNNRREGSCSIGATVPATDFFLSEGSTAWGFTTYVCVQNPNNSEAEVTITYMTPDGALPQDPFTMPANSRRTVKVNDEAGMWPTDLSTMVHADKPIVAERAMYWNNGTGEACHDSVGLDAAHMSFMLPDGQTSGGFETYTCVQNPNPSSVTVRVTYLLAGGGTPVSFTDEIPKDSRRTYNMADKGVTGRASILVESLDGARPIMAERAMYWNSKGAGTSTIGGFADSATAPI